MASQKILSKVFNIVFPFTDFLYLLQQEEYSFQRIWFWLPRFFLKRNFQNRDKLVYTQRVKMTLALSILLFIISGVLMFFWAGINIFLFIIVCLSIPIIVLIANLSLNPFYEFIKNRIIKKAASHFRIIRGNAKVIAITGSYGKTTVKNFIEQLVRFTHKTQMIPGNINSTIGIANWILNNYRNGTDVLIVEMDSYCPKRISESTKLVAPDFAIITNIGDQHLQRYKSKENLARSLFELFEYSSKKTIKITDNETLDYLRSQKFNTMDIVTINNTQQNALISNSHNKNFQYALFVANILKIPTDYIEHISKNLVVPERRQSYKKLFGFDGIDDSYNISFTTAYAGIIEARNQAQKDKKKLLVITAGIPELGPFDQERNKDLGSLLDQKSDRIFILKSIFYKEIFSGIKNKEKIYCYNNFGDAIKNLQKEYDSKEWFLLIQPELTDIYY